MTSLLVWCETVLYMANRLKAYMDFLHGLPATLARTNPTTSSAKSTGLPDYKFTDTDWLHCAGREVDSDGMEVDDVSPEREKELALKALDYILLTVPSS